MKRLMVVLAACVVLGAHAQTVPVPPRAGVVTLEANATSEVAFDIAALTLVTEAEHKDPAQLAQIVNRTVEEAMAIAKAESRVAARSGGYRTFPVTDREGRISAWRSRAELILESRDFKVLSALAGRLSSLMQVAGISFVLSPEARRAEEEALIGQAIARFQSRAQSAAKAFGYAGYSLLEVAVHTQTPGPPPPRPALRSAIAAEAAPVPLEGGRATVTVSVSGSVQLLK